MKNSIENYSHNHDSESEYLEMQIQESLDAYAQHRCPRVLKGNFDRFKSMTPDERIKLFHEMSDTKRMDLLQSPAESTKALVGSSDAQDGLKQTLLENGYEDIRLVEKDNLRFDIAPIKGLDGVYLFGRDKVLWECDKGDDSPDYVVKRSHFVANDDFMDVLDIDPNFLYLSDKKTEWCEALLGDDEENTLITPHSVLYTIRTEYPTDNATVYSPRKIKKILDMLKKDNGENETSSEQTSPSPDGELYVDNNIN